MKRDLLDLVRRPKRFVQRLRAFALGSALASVGLLSAPPAVASVVPTSSTTEPLLGSVIVNRTKKAAKLVLKLPGSVGAAFAAHSSHRSHSSHSSHSSHYSGTSGVVRRPSSPAPAPAPVASPPPAPAPLLSALGANTITGKFQRFDRVNRTLHINDAIGTAFEFSWRDDTTIPGGQRIDEYLEAHATHPFSAGQALTLVWKPSTDGKKRVLVSIR